MAGTSQQPSKVTTEDTPKPRDISVVTDETETVTLAPDNVAESTSDAGSDQSTDNSAESDDKPKPKKKSRRDRQAERRLRQLHADLAEEKDARKQDADRIAELEAQVDELTASTPKPKKPVLADFDSPEEFADAYADWKTKSAKPARKPEAKPKAKSTPKPADTRPVASQEELEDFHTVGVEVHGDKFLAAQQDKNMAIDVTMGEFILDSEIGPSVFLYLHEHPKEMKTLFDERSVVEKVKQLQAIEKSIESGKAREPEDDDQTGDDDDKRDPKTGKFKSKTESKAPPPGPDTDAGTVVPDKDLGKADMDSYAATRRAQLKKKGYRM